MDKAAEAKPSTAAAATAPSATNPTTDKKHTASPTDKKITAEKTDSVADDKKQLASSTSSPSIAPKASSSSLSTGNCYCNKERDVGTVELLCATCNKWFHEACISSSAQFGKLIPFATNYVFFCKGCSPSGSETYRKCQATISQMCITALANLHQGAGATGTDKALFAKDRELIPYMEQHWEAMTTMPRRVTQSWYTTVQKTLHKDTNTVFTFEESAERGQMFGLLSTDLAAIRPNYDAMVKAGTLRADEAAGTAGLKSSGGGSGGATASSGNGNGGFGNGGGGGGSGAANSSASTAAGSSAGNLAAGNQRQNKRKLTGNNASGIGDGSGVAGGAGGAGGPAGKKGRPTSDLTSNVKLPAHGYPMDHPYNKDGYRYILAEPDPHAPYRQEFDEGADWAGKPIPGWLYRTLTPNAVLLALHDRAPQLKIADDRLSVTGEKGYCMVRSTHYVMRGSWYFEATIEDMPDGSAVRIGWGQEYANLQAPLGYDKFGYSWRSRKGTRFHDSHGKSYSPGYGEGDTVGFLIELPDPTSSATCLDYLPSTFKDKPLVKFKSHLYYEDKDRVNEALKALRVLPRSRIVFFRNGEPQGDAFVDIFQGAYAPTLSLFRGATVSVNFGPNFKLADVETTYKCRGMSRRVDNMMCEQVLADMLYLMEHDGKLRLDSL